MQLGRRHHELDVGRRLFDGLQEGVERFFEPMDFVDDENLDDRASAVQQLDDDLADRVGRVGGAVDLGRRVTALRDLETGVVSHAQASAPPINARQNPAVVVFPTPRGQQMKDCASRAHVRF
jgi:hypothetical protein